MSEDAGPAGFAASRGRLEEVISWAAGQGAAAASHGELEAYLVASAREMFRQLFQDVLDLRAIGEPHLAEVLDAAGVAHRYAEEGHTRSLETVLGTVVVTRVAYRHRGEKNLCPLDTSLNLPVERQSHGLRRLAAVESTRDSFEGAVEAIERATGVLVGKRQVEQLAQAAAVDFEAFYAERKPVKATPEEVLVVSADGKGIVMRPDSLRDQTATAAAREAHKLDTRLSGGEKRNRKRMAEIGAVYDLKAVPRTAEDILGRRAATPDKPQAPKAASKW